MVFNSTGMAPGVYIREIDEPGPIAGVSTGVVAIVGPALSGPINSPVYVTNWTQFTNTFGGYMYDPPVYAAHAVRGFFDNGGSVCCFVRAGKAKQAGLVVRDSSPARLPVFNVTARAEGKQGDDISIALADAKLCETTVVKHSAAVETLASNKMSVNLGDPGDVSGFIAGDFVRVTQGAITEEAEITFVSGASKEIRFRNALVKAFSSEKTDPIIMRLDDLQGKRRVRLQSVAGIEAGSYLKLSQGAGEPAYASVDSVVGDTVILRAPIQQGLSLLGGDPEIIVRSLEFSISISRRGNLEEKYENLSLVPYHSRYFERVAAASRLVSVALGDTPNSNSLPDNLPDPAYGPNNANLSGGVDDSPGGLSSNYYEDALEALEKATVNIVCAPDAVSFDPDGSSVRKLLIAHCEKMGDRFAILDSGRNYNCNQAIAQRKNELGDSTYAAYYYPWIEISHPAGQGRLRVPPSGHIAGVYARTDDLKGVHKAPGNEVIQACLGVTSTVNDKEHGMLNEDGINAIINIPGNGVTLMGARTLSYKTQWRYINVRRLLLYIEKSIQNATRFSVFLPNNPSLWAAVKRQVTDFLNNVWRSGALFGTAPSQAFYVKVDEELNPPSTRALGQLIIEIVLYPVTPAEFIVFRIIQQPGGPSVSEGE